jgi:hypothetical protein
MPAYVVILTYLAAFAFSVLCLYWFGKARWYWHVLAVATAFAVGLTPPSVFEKTGVTGPSLDLILGSLFIVLLVWGVAEPIYDALHLPHHSRRHQA